MAPCEGGGGGREIRGLRSGSNEFLIGRFEGTRGCVWCFFEVVGVWCGQIRPLTRHRSHSALFSSRLPSFRACWSAALRAASCLLSLVSPVPVFCPLSKQKTRQSITHMAGCPVCEHSQRHTQGTAEQSQHTPKQGCGVLSLETIRCVHMHVALSRGCLTSCSIFDQSRVSTLRCKNCAPSPRYTRFSGCFFLRSCP